MAERCEKLPYMEDTPARCVPSSQRERMTLPNKVIRIKSLKLFTAGVDDKSNIMPKITLGFNLK